ncbi:cytosolic 5'-nucleotidase 3 [Lingula anatina]|uniref:5'-nucleotidase n=1 Tax=Lingula anatina TaxID=7574 RepID=A0A1S3III2_LINAN|nr:cytosolic 5'-nucleotidase 3 [Lingula anatina]|eukprot:XP_013397691.1 cytosolic 5'-nucleotidase 3 [Lingula anatina]
MAVVNWSGTKISLGISALVGLVGIGYILVKHRKRKRQRIVDTIDELQKVHVHIKDRDRVEQILLKLVEGGKEKLQIVADFDFTLSKFTEKGNRCSSTHNILDSSPVLPVQYREQAVALRDFYFAIEINHEMTLAQKVPYMVEWWTKAHNLLVQCNLRKGMIPEMIQASNAKLRDGCTWMFNQLHKHQVPLLIFSAGLGDIIEEIVQQQSTLHENIKIVSNYMDFNHQGVCVGFKGEMIHVFNKNENAIHNSDYFENLSHRPNVILMGDSIGDLHMADGATTDDVEPCKLNIGFLNTNIEERLETYKGLFDIVLVNDETVDICNSILKRIL